MSLPHLCDPSAVLNPQRPQAKSLQPRFIRTGSSISQTGSGVGVGHVLQGVRRTEYLVVGTFPYLGSCKEISQKISSIATSSFPFVSFLPEKGGVFRPSTAVNAQFLASKNRSQSQKGASSCEEGARHFMTRP